MMFKRRSRRMNCVVVEGGEPCPYYVKVTVPIGKTHDATAFVRVCAWHGSMLVRSITGMDVEL